MMKAEACRFGQTTGKSARKQSGFGANMTLKVAATRVVDNDDYCVSGKNKSSNSTRAQANERMATI